ncbi:MAG: 4Fe-4S dicluster domain-containing protein [Ruminococcaceae bacterium]|nr:4Fe-4S dicluster domain-containing protein [Oscillospiraceae bacterium]
MSFEKIKGKLGFGFMRLPMSGAEVDTALTCEMVDTFMKRGFNYFDTAHGYVGGKSESTLKTCLTSRYPRESYVLTDKLSTHFFTRQEQIRPLFESQLKACGLDYFDFYLMHAQDASIYSKFQKCKAYETAMEFKKEGKIKHLGISFHDKAAVLEDILLAHPEIEVVQIQLNYADYDDPSVESRKCYEVCEKFDKKVIVMEPIKGGSLIDLPSEAKKIFDSLGGGSYASYAVRFAAGFKNILTVLSGMSSMRDMLDNTSYMSNFKPLSAEELAAVKKVVEIFKSQNLIPCTACKYCMEECPKHIPIPELFSLLNSKKRFDSWNQSYYYSNVHTVGGRKASDCLQCGKCEKVCPQHLPIRSLLKDVAKTFE